MSRQATDDVRLYWRLLRIARPEWPRLISIFLLGLLAAPVSLLLPLPLKIITDSVVLGLPLPWPLTLIHSDEPTIGSVTVIGITVALVIGVAILDQMQRMATSFLSVYTAERLSLIFRAHLFEHAQRLSLSYHDQRGSSDSAYRIQQDALGVQSALVFGISPLAGALFMLLGMVAISATLDWELAALALIIVPLVTVATFRARGRLREAWGTMHQLDSAAFSVIQESLQALRTVKAFGQEHWEQQRLADRLSKSFRTRVDIAATDAMFSAAIGLILAVGTALVLFLGSLHVVQERISLGELILIMAYLAQLYIPLQLITWSITNIQSSISQVQRGFDLLDQSTEVVEIVSPRNIVRSTGLVEFRNVSFNYTAGPDILTNISFRISPGVKLGIVGTTGSGKTTLVSLLNRFYDPTKGRILLDDIDIRQYSVSALRSQFAIALQDSVLFSSTIADNIRYARPSASRQSVVDAAKAAQAHEFIVNLPDGYDTLVGEQGTRLSGGERQRVGLARAFLKDAPILILDEPTSSVDVGTERAIIDAMMRLMDGRTVIMIAHRLSSLAACDLLLAIEKGAIAIEPSPLPAAAKRAIDLYGAEAHILAGQSGRGSQVAEPTPL